MHTSIFEKIASREDNGFIIWEDDNYIAILDVFPLVKGHTLIAPKVNLGDYLFDLDDKSYSELLLTAKKVAKLLKTKIDCDRIMMGVEGLEIPHVHLFLLPIANDFNITKATVQSISKDELRNIQELIIN